MADTPKTNPLHYKYVIFILGIIIISLLTFRYAPDTLLSNYVSFAATISSLILAILAIIQGLYSTNSVSETAENIRSSSAELVQNSQRLDEIIRQLDEKVSVIPGLIKNLGDGLTAVLNNNQSTKATNIELPEVSEEQFKYFLNKSSLAGKLMIYWVIQSKENEKTFTSETFTKVLDDELVGRYFYAYFLACMAFGLFSLEQTEKRPYTYKVLELNPILKDYNAIFEEKAQNQGKVFSAMKAKVDGYFEDENNV